MSDDEIIDTGLFEEPEDFYQKPPEPTFDYYERDPKFVQDGQPSKITMRLVGKSPLWGHLLWNAGKLTAHYIDKNRKDWIDGKLVLELGAAAALPTLLAALSAKKVVTTDYPDIDLMENIQYNVDLLAKQVSNKGICPVDVKGYRWGEPLSTIWDGEPNEFDFIIMSDLIFNHTEHQRLLQTCLAAIKPNTGKIFVVFTPHRPKLKHKDFEFFDSAKEAGFTVEKYVEKKMTPMFEEDEETKDVRSMVYGYILTLEK